jgi:hypothetical protein
VWWSAVGFLLQDVVINDLFPDTCADPFTTTIPKSHTTHTPFGGFGCSETATCAEPPACIVCVDVWMWVWVWGVAVNKRWSGGITSHNAQNRVWKPPKLISAMFS